MTRTACPRASNARATTEPVFPVTPATANMASSFRDGERIPSQTNSCLSVKEGFEMAP